MAVKTVDPDEVEAADILGSAIERREDPALVTGEAEYTDDLHRQRLAHLSIVRSQHAHAVLEGIDTSAAADHDDVVAVYTAEDLEAAGVPGELGVGWLLPDLKQVSYPILARDRVRFHGQPVALVVAEDRYAAAEAAGLVEVEYERLDAVVEPRAAVSEGAPQLHEDAPNNVAFDWELGDAEAVDDAFDDADHVVELDLRNQRLIPNAMEPRATVADYHPGTEELEVHLTTQNPHVHRLLMSGVLGVPEHKLRIVAPEVGGGFGSKIHTYPDESLTCFCAMQLGRPVKWQATRSESYLADAHGRDHETTAELALDDDGNFTGLRVATHANLGAYLSEFAPLIPTFLYGTMIPGQYSVPAYHCNVVGTFTNTCPVDAYRGAGRPEATYVIERIVDAAADELGVDPAELRRQNFIDEFPAENNAAMVYDSGDYETALDAALEAADYASLRERQDELREEGRYLGIGVASYIEACGAAPSAVAGELGAQAGLWESGVVRFDATGTVTVYAGTSGHGQGHATTYAQIVASELGVDYADVEVVEGDTEEIPMGMGTYASRSAAVGGSALVTSARKVVDKARTIAAHHLEAAEADVAFEGGEFYVEGAPDRSMGIKDVALQAYLAHDLPEGLEPGLEATSFYDPENFVFPFGTHVAVVEVDPDSGEFEIERYVAVDDCGPQINPKIVEGQLHGGIVQGLGQAITEGAVYDENGQLVSGTMLDYAIPKTINTPDMETESTVTESPHNPLGVKGVGEAGTIGAAPALVNAVCDALAPFGVDDIDMPLSSEAVWQAVNGEGGEV